MFSLKVVERSRRLEAINEVLKSKDRVLKYLDKAKLNNTVIDSKI